MNNDKTTTVQSIMTPLPLETANLSTNVRDIANKMKEKNKGAIIIVEGQKKRDDASGSGSGGTDKPIGIITQRDIVRRVVAANESTDPKKILASEIMSQPLITVGDGHNNAEYLPCNIQSINFCAHLTLSCI